MHVASLAAVREHPADRALPGLPSAWFAIPWLLGVAALWWVTFDAVATGAPEAADVPAEALRVGVAMAVSFKAIGSLAESGFYAGAWLLRGRRVPFARLWTWLAALSLLDALALLLPWAVEPQGGVLRAGIAALCGPRTLAAPDEILSHPGLALFGPLGVLTLLRIGLTGWVQARAARCAPPGPLALTAAMWLAMRVVTWWLGELMRGQSALMTGAAS